MHVVIAAISALLALSLVSPPAVSTAFAQESCRCKGCGCKGGPGWRGPDGACVSKAKLAEICGSPAGTPHAGGGSAGLFRQTVRSDGP